MIMNMYLLYDKVADEYGPVFEAKNDDVARRSVRPLFKDGNMNDYTLLCVGQIDRSLPFVIMDDRKWRDLPNLLEDPSDIDDVFYNASLKGGE